MTTEKLSSAGRRLLSGSVLRVCNLFIAAATSFMLMPFVVHHIGDRLYGFWTLSATFVGYYGVLDFGISSAVSQYISVAIGRNDDAECRAVFNTALRIQLMLGGLVLLATAAVAAAAPRFSQGPADAALFVKVIVISGVSVALGFPMRAYSGVLESKLRFDIQSWIGLTALTVRTALTVWAVWKGGQLLSLAWIGLFGSLLVAFLDMWFARRVAPWARIERSSIVPKGAKRLFSYSIYTFMGMLGDMLRFQVDAVVIASMIGLAAVTHYRVASQFSAYYINIICCIVGMLQPVLSRLHGAQDRSGLERVFFFATKVSLCVSIFIGISLISWGKPFIGRWMGLRYEDAYWPLVVLTLAVFLDVGQNPSITLLYATFKHRFYTYMNCAEGVINLGISLALAKPLGVLGVALGTLIAAVLIRMVAQPYWVCRATGLHYGNYMKFMGNITLRCGLLIGAAIVVSAWGLKPSYPWLISSAICATAIYAAGSWLFVFNQREREQLLGIISRRSRKQAELEPVGAAL